MTEEERKSLVGRLRNNLPLMKAGEDHWRTDHPAIELQNREAAAQIEADGKRIAELENGLSAAVRAAELALFIMQKQGVMANSGWADDFKKDLLQAARAAMGEQL